MAIEYKSPDELINLGRDQVGLQDPANQRTPDQQRLSINSFVQAFKDGFIHPNLFRVTFACPLFKQEDLLMLGMACKTAKIPGVTYTEANYSVNSINRKFPSGADLDPAEFVFYCDKNTSVMKTIDTWAANIFDFNSGIFGFKDDYQGSIHVEILDREGNSIYEGVLENVYPTVVATYELSYENENQIMEYAVTFNYDRVLSPQVQYPLKDTSAQNAGSRNWQKLQEIRGKLKEGFDYKNAAQSALTDYSDEYKNLRYQHDKLVRDLKLNPENLL